MKSAVKKSIVFIIAAVMAMIGIGAGILHAVFGGRSLADDTKKSFTVTAAEQLSELRDCVYNDVINLQSDITVTNVEALCSADKPFVGVFDGHGFTVRFTGKTFEPLIGYIGKGGIVKNLVLAFDSPDIVETEFAFIAYKNDGIITDCKIVGDMEVRGGAYSALALVNSGIVKSIISELNVSQIEDTPVVFGSLCAYNCGVIKGAIAEPKKFEFSVRDRNIGCFAGDCGVDISGVIIGDPSNLSEIGIDSVKIGARHDEVYTSDNLFGVLDFSSESWLCSGGTAVLICEVLA